MVNGPCTTFSHFVRLFGKYVTFIQSIILKTKKNVCAWRKCRFFLVTDNCKYFFTFLQLLQGRFSSPNLLKTCPSRKWCPKLLFEWPFDATRNRNVHSFGGILCFYGCFYGLVFCLCFKNQKARISVEYKFFYPFQRKTGDGRKKNAGTKCSWLGLAG